MPSAIRVILSFLFYSGFCLALVSPPAIADAEHAQVLNSAGQQLREQGQLTDKVLRDLQRSADGLLLLAWLHEHSRYAQGWRKGLRLLSAGGRARPNGGCPLLLAALFASHAGLA